MDNANKRIAKNTLFLYVRMILILGVSLYTSRVVLNALGVDDYGIYNLVGGIVVLFSFINGAMTSATQRFLNFEMGKIEDSNVNKIFCISMNTYFLICISIAILAETIGLWFLNQKLNIPVERLSAANVVYQFSIFTFIINIIVVPYNASIIAFEKMSFFAWVSLLEVSLKLIVVFILVYYTLDKLILYGVLTFCVAIIMFLVYRFYCLKNFGVTCRYSYMRDKKVFFELLSFSGWSMFGNVAVVGAKQGVPMIMNIFLGVTVNAAIGIANQVNSALYNFVSNFQKAFNPQMVKTYASGEHEQHRKLLFQASKFSYFLILVLAIPILFNTDYILTLWLKKVPNYTVIFTQITIAISLFEALSGPFWMSISATGNIKRYQIIISIIIILNLPIAYLLLTYGYPASYVFFGKLALTGSMYIFRIIHARSFLYFSVSEFFHDTLLKIFSVTILVVTCSFLLKNYLFKEVNTIISLLFFIIISLTISSLSVLFLGTKRKERYSIIKIITKKIKR